MAAFENIRSQLILVNSLSKTYAMTGFRLGYVVAAQAIINAIDKIIQSSTTCPTSFVQKAGIAALRGPQDAIPKMMDEYNRRRQFIVKMLNEIPDIHCAMPHGAFYVFPNFTALKLTSLNISLRLLSEVGVCSTPGSVFGKCGEGYIRLSYAAHFEIISAAVKQIEKFVSSIVSK
jgi:aspartate/methionine/tyrosine aminotransferase